MAEKIQNCDISRYTNRYKLLLDHFVVPGSTSKWHNESFLGFLVFEIFFFKVEIFAVFCDLKKSYRHQISEASTSRLHVKTRLLLLSEASTMFFRSVPVDFETLDVHRKKFCSYFTSGTVELFQR